MKNFDRDFTICQPAEKVAAGVKICFKPGNRSGHGQRRMKRRKLFGPCGRRGARSGNREVTKAGDIILMNPPDLLTAPPVAAPVAAPTPVPAPKPAAPANFRHTATTELLVLEYSVGLVTGLGTVTRKPKAGGQRVISLTRNKAGEWRDIGGARHTALEKAIAAAGFA